MRFFLRGRISLALFVASSIAGVFPFVQSGCSSDDKTQASTDAASDITVPADQSAPQDSSITDAGADARDSASAPDASPDCEPDGATTSGPPQDLKCTGLYSDWTSQTISANAMEYKPAYTLWSDGADKRRWIYLPPGTQIDTSDMDNWIFPVGTKFWKQFAFSGKNVETRLYHKVADATWEWTTYQWSTDQTSAVRLDTGAGADAGGDASYAGYEIPDSTKCSRCHQGAKDSILGFEAVGLGVAGATGITLTQLQTSGLLTQNPPSLTIAIPNELTGNDAPSLGWLHANCGLSCHNTIGNCYMRAHMKIKYSELHYGDGGAATVPDLELYQTTYNQPAAFGGANRITPGEADASAIFNLVDTRNAIEGNTQMPPIDSHQVDAPNTAALEAWIDSLQ